MVTYSRTIAQIASVPPPPAPLPTWRQAMTETDRLYKASAAPPSQADSSIVFPSGVVPYGFGNGGWGWDVMSGYSSGALLEDVGGPFGTLVFGTGGHTRIQNQILSLGISSDAPTFGWFQQPYFETSAVNGAELYYNRAEFDALPTQNKTGNGGGTEVAMTQVWRNAGAPFPMGYEGWIFPRKIVTGQLGRNNPHGFRYMAPNYVPPSMTGTGSGAYVVVEAPQGPFAQSWQPAGSIASELVDPAGLWPSGRRKWPVWVKNVSTGHWERIASGFQPDYAPYGFIRQHTAVARDQKRVYVSSDVGGGTAAWWYVDFASGVAGATISSLVAPSANVAPNRATSGAFTDGHPGGRHLWYWPDLLNPRGLVVQDLDAKTQTRLDIGQGLDIPSSAAPGMQYDSANNRIIVFRNDGGTLKYRTISLPADPLNVAGYAVSAERAVAVDASVPLPVTPSHFYSKAPYHRQLGVVFIPQDQGPMLAFRPAL